MAEFSVIIVSYNHYELLSDCLNSIYKYNDIGNELEIIVSDNSPDLTLINMVRKNYPNVKTIKNANIGFGAGNNRGVEISTGRYLLFLNPDTILTEPIFEFAIKKFKEDDALGAFNVRLVKRDLTSNNSFLLLDDNSFIDQYIFRKYYEPNGRFIDRKMSLIGADIFIRREVFIEAGKFDENIFMYCEEGDLLRRIFKLPTYYKTDFYEDKHIIHLEGGTQSKDEKASLRQLRNFLDSYSYYCKKWNINFSKEVRKLIKNNYIYIFIKRVKNDSIAVKNLQEKNSIYESYIK